MIGRRSISGQRTRRRRVLTTLVLAVLSTGALVLSAVPANALHLDYSDPAGTHCADNSYPVGTANIVSPYGQVLGTVTLKYSNSCGTNWAKVQNNSSYSQIRTWATRPNYDGATTVGHGGDPGPYKFCA